MRRLASLIAVSITVACTSSQENGSTSGASTPDAEADADGGPATCHTEAGTGLPCQQSLATFCENANYQFPYGACGETWSSVLARDPCSWLPSEGPGGLRIESCGSLEVIDFLGADFGTRYFFDVPSGALAGVVWISDPGIYTCGAGQACFASPDPTTCKLTAQPGCTDGGPRDGAPDVHDASAQ